jgi:hypothetical protein
MTNVSGRVNLTWNASTGARSYNLFQSTDGVTYTLLVSGRTTRSFSHTGLTPGVPRYYRVQASSLGGVSAQSSPVMGTPLP